MTALGKKPVLSSWYGSPRFSHEWLAIRQLPIGQNKDP